MVEKNYFKNYYKTEKGKEAIKRAQKKYRETNKGRQTIKRAIHKYYNTEKGKEAVLNAVRKYQQSEHGSKRLKKYNHEYYLSHKDDILMKQKIYKTQRGRRQMECDRLIDEIRTGLYNLNNAIMQQKIKLLHENIKCWERKVEWCDRCGCNVIYEEEFICNDCSRELNKERGVI